MLGAASRRVAADFASPKITQFYLDPTIWDSGSDERLRHDMDLYNPWKQTLYSVVS
jgi:hypothetical protein